MNFRSLPALLLCGVALAGAVRAQAADDCALATPISGSGLFPFSTFGATLDGPAVCGSPTEDVWYTWTALASDQFFFETCGVSSADTVIAAYEGGGCPVGELLACSDDACGTQSSISFTTVTNRSYLLRIGTKGGFGGGVLSIRRATTDCLAPAPGPDVVIGNIRGVSNWGGVGGVSAFSLGTTSCNVGSAELNWVGGTNQHPVIGQNMYRLENGRFEQLGMSWLKHGFAAFQGSLCCDCIPSGSNGRLGVGCSDPYGSGLNGQQAGLGPRFEVNPHTGEFAYPFTGQGAGGGVLYKRIQVANSELDPALHPTALFFGEGHYITPDDAVAGNGNNNVSYRRMVVGSVAGGAVNMNLGGVTVRGEPARPARKENDPGVRITGVQVPGEGYFVVGSRATDNGDGTWHYEYAIHNINSHAAGGSFEVPLLPGATVTNVGFHDVAYHSGEPFDGTDWAGVHAGGVVRWSTEAFAVNPGANALRWGTLYNFRFDADVGPATGTATLGLFRPNTPDSVGVEVALPGCAPQVASETVRAGTPPNPVALLPGVTSGPVTGKTWDPVVDHTTFFPGAGLDFLLVNIDGIGVNTVTGAGTLLCALPPSQFVFLSDGPGVPFSLPIPDDCVFVGRSVCVQGGSLGGGTVQLTNALDLIVGNL